MKRDQIASLSFVFPALLIIPENRSLCFCVGRRTVWASWILVGVRPVIGALFLLHGESSLALRLGPVDGKSRIAHNGFLLSSMATVRPARIREERSENKVKRAEHESSNPRAGGGGGAR